MCQSTPGRHVRDDVSDKQKREPLVINRNRKQAHASRAHASREMLLLRIPMALQSLSRTQLRKLSSGVKAEHAMRNLLIERLAATHCTVEDTSGGCGSFFRVRCVSPVFEGLAPLAQHRRVQEALKTEIGTMHGLTIETMTPAAWRAKNPTA